LTVDDEAASVGGFFRALNHRCDVCSCLLLAQSGQSARARVSPLLDQSGHWAGSNLVFAAACHSS
jgi:hypothetical protein